MKTISGSDIKLEAREHADAIRAEELGAFHESVEREINAALAAYGDQLSKMAWGDPPYPTEARARYVPTIRERIRWRWRAMRQWAARALLWALRVEPEELCDCDY